MGAGQAGIAVFSSIVPRAGIFADGLQDHVHGDLLHAAAGVAGLLKQGLQDSSERITV
jgi:hypothetical protein